MNEYWKDPRLDDEGTYDYLVEELPNDSKKWEWYYQKCDSCGKHHRLNFESTHYSYCYDGWDSMSYVECWRCKLKSKIDGWRYKFKKNRKKKKIFKNIIKDKNLTKEQKKYLKEAMI